MSTSSVRGIFGFLSGMLLSINGRGVYAVLANSSPNAWTAQGPGCTCSFVYDPVCGKDGFTYINLCEALCDKAEVDYPGMCMANDSDPRVDNAEDKCTSCPLLVKWVCGVDGSNYASGCAATCNGIQVAYAGTCVINEYTIA